MTRIGDLFQAVALEAAAQWGMFTTAQAHEVGLNNNHLAALIRRGTIIRAKHGVYRIVGAPDDIALDELRTAWLTTSTDWIPEGSPGPVTAVSHLSAAHTVHRLGTLRSDWLHLTTPTPRRTRSRDLQLHTATLEPHDWQIVDGLPVTTIARTIADVYLDHIDGGHLGDILRDALEIAVAPAADIIATLDSATDGRGRELVEDCLNQNGTPPYVLAGNELLTQHRAHHHTSRPRQHA